MEKLLKKVMGLGRVYGGLRIRLGVKATAKFSTWLSHLIQIIVLWGCHYHYQAHLPDGIWGLERMWATQRGSQRIGDSLTSEPVLSNTIWIAQIFWEVMAEVRVKGKSKKTLLWLPTLLSGIPRNIWETFQVQATNKLICVYFLLLYWAIQRAPWCGRKRWTSLVCFLPNSVNLGKL